MERFRGLHRRSGLIIPDPRYQRESTRGLTGRTGLPTSSATTRYWESKLPVSCPFSIQYPLNSDKKVRLTRWTTKTELITTTKRPYARLEQIRRSLFWLWASVPELARQRA